MGQTVPRTVFDDPGSTQIALFVGWIPAAVAAVIGGIAVAILTRGIEAFVIVAVAGTVVGYVVCLIGVLGIGQLLAKRISPSVADWVFGGFMLSGAGAAIVVAILGLIGLHLAGIAAIVAVGFVIVVVAYLVISDSSSGRLPLP